MVAAPFTHLLLQTVLGHCRVGVITIFLEDVVFDALTVFVLGRIKVVLVPQRFDYERVRFVVRRSLWLRRILHGRRQRRHNVAELRHFCLGGQRQFPESVPTLRCEEKRSEASEIVVR